LLRTWVAHKIDADESLLLIPRSETGNPAQVELQSEIDAKIRAAVIGLVDEYYKAVIGFSEQRAASLGDRLLRKEYATKGFHCPARPHQPRLTLVSSPSFFTVILITTITDTRQGVLDKKTLLASERAAAYGIGLLVTNMYRYGSDGNARHGSHSILAQFPLRGCLCYPAPASVLVHRRDQDATVPHPLHSVLRPFELFEYRGGL